MKRLSIVSIILPVLVAAAVLAKMETKPKTAKPAVFKMATGSPIKVGPMAGDPVIADSDHDGNLDIILACGTCCGSPPDPLSGHVQVLRGDGRGGFKPAQGSPIPVGSSARKVAVGDANHDGHLDIFVAQHESYEVVALLGDGRGSFKPAPASPFVSASGPQVHPRAHTHAITTGDVNGDGNLDILTTNANDNSVSVHPVDWPVIFDDTGWDNAIARSYGVNRLPAHIIIDREGIVRLIAEGGDRKKMAEIRSALQRLI